MSVEPVLLEIGPTLGPDRSDQQNTLAKKAVGRLTKPILSSQGAEWKIAHGKVEVSNLRRDFS
jgi:hypothetical protein